MEAAAGEADVAGVEGGLAQTRKAASLERSMRSGQRLVTHLGQIVEMLHYLLVIPLLDVGYWTLQKAVPGLPLQLVGCPYSPGKLVHRY